MEYKYGEIFESEFLCVPFFPVQLITNRRGNLVYNEQ